MTWSARAEFLDHGFVAVDDALDAGFCEAVVQRGFARLGMDESDPTTWPPGRTHLGPDQHWSLADVAPRAQGVLDELVEPCRVGYGGIQDNLILNVPLAGEDWWGPDEALGHPEGWHKDGDWFRHFLDSPEQGLLVIVFWRTVVERQGPTCVATDSIVPVACHLAERPEGLDPSEMRVVTDEVLADCREFRALVGRQGTIVFAHPFMLHSVSPNDLGTPRVISNSSVMLRSPMSFDRPDGAYSAVEETILRALDVDRFEFAPTGDRSHIRSDRSRRWAAQRNTSGVES